MKGVKIGEKHCYDDWGLILTSKTIEPPTPQISKVIVPLRDGSIDLTTAVTDEVKYNDRKISLTFSVKGSVEELAIKISEIENYLQGQWHKIVFEDDAAFYYIGRLAVKQWDYDRNIGTLVIEATVEPFKYDIFSSAVDWEWDIFDFEQGIINETGALIVDGSTTITLICRKKRMFPVFTASADMTVTFGGDTYALKAGSQKVYDIFFVEGENEMTFTGNGTITIDYTGGSL